MHEITWKHSRRCQVFYFLFLFSSRQQGMTNLHGFESFFVDSGSWRRWMVSKGTVVSSWWQLPIDQISWTMPCWDQADSIDRVTVGLPDVKGREQILNVHIRNKKLAEGITLNEIAKRALGIRKQVQTTLHLLMFVASSLICFDGIFHLTRNIGKIGKTSRWHQRNGWFQRCRSWELDEWVCNPSSQAQQDCHSPEQWYLNEIVGIYDNIWHTYFTVHFHFYGEFILNMDR